MKKETAARELRKTGGGAPRPKPIVKPLKNQPTQQPPAKKN